MSEVESATSDGPVAAPPSVEGDEQGEDLSPILHEAEDVHPRDVVLSLSRAARSFVTYDARNDTVRKLIDAYRRNVSAALEHHGDLVFEVRPFELAWNNEVVYVEEDREKSLAFRMFRDGVRELTIKSGVSWQELLTLLEILSIRYVGIRQQEEDTLTLLRQADFQQIAFVVVEAYVPSEEQPEEIDSQIELEMMRPPQDWDLPLPRLAGGRPLVFRDLGDEELAPVSLEGDDSALAALAARVAQELLRLAAERDDDALKESVLQQIEEICAFFVIELCPAELVKTVREAERLLAGVAGVEQLAEKFGGGDVLERFLRDPEDVEPDALMPLFSLVATDHLSRVVDRFVREPNAAVRAVLKTVLSRLAVGRPDVLLDRLGDVPTEPLVDLFNVVCVVAPPERTLEAAFSLARHPSPEVKLGAMEFLGAAPMTARLEQVILQLVQDEAPRVRLKAVAILSQRRIGGGRGYALLRDMLEQRAREGLEPLEASTLGLAMMRVARQYAIPQLRECIKPAGLKAMVDKVKFGGAHRRMLRWAAVAGLVEDNCAETRKLIHWLAKHSDAELRAHCEAALEKMGPARKGKQGARKDKRRGARKEKRKDEPGAAPTAEAAPESAEAAEPASALQEADETATAEETAPERSEAGEAAAVGKPEPGRGEKRGRRSRPADPRREAAGERPKPLEKRGRRSRPADPRREAAGERSKPGEKRGRRSRPADPRREPDDGPAHTVERVRIPARDPRREPDDGPATMVERVRKLPYDPRREPDDG